MRSLRTRDTLAEMRVRRLLHSQGLRYRVDYKPLKDLRRRADIVFPAKHVAVFIDGCFWHSCPLHGQYPVANAEWWADKLRRTSERDRETDQILMERGWTVLRFWEHEEPAEVASEIVRIVHEEKPQTGKVRP